MKPDHPVNSQATKPSQNRKKAKRKDSLHARLDQLIRSNIEARVLAIKHPRTHDFYSLADRLDQVLYRTKREAGSILDLHKAAAIEKGAADLLLLIESKVKNFCAIVGIKYVYELRGI